MKPSTIMMATAIMIMANKTGRLINNWRGAFSGNFFSMRFPSRSFYSKSSSDASSSHDASLFMPCSPFDLHIGFLCIPQSVGPQRLVDQ